MKRFLSCLAILTCCTMLSAADWPHWRGPNRDNKSPEKGLLKVWPKGGPKVAWQVDTIGLGYSAPAIVGDQLFILGANDGKTELYAHDLKTGKQQWKLPFATPFTFKGNAWGIGPRAAPSVDDGHVYALSGDGNLICAEAKSGKKVWQVDYVKDLGGSINPIGGGPKIYAWGFCAAPVIDGDNVICLTGGAKGYLAALNKKTGKVAWRSTDLTDMGTYATPVIATIHGVKQYVVLTQAGIAGIGAEKGDLLWYYKKSRPYPDVVITTPVVDGNTVYSTQGFGAGCELIDITKTGDKLGAKEAYSNKYVKNPLGGVVLHEGFIYGTSERRGWICQDIKNGKLKWFKRRVVGDGSIVFADGHLYLYDERNADVGLIEASPKGWNLKSKFTLPKTSTKRAPSGKAWTHPVIAQGMLFIRDQELLYAFKIK